MPCLSPAAAATGLTERYAHVLDGVVRIHVQITTCRDVQVDATVAGDLVEHVLEKRQPRVDLGATKAVQIYGEVDARLQGLAALAGRSVGHVRWGPRKRGRSIPGPSALQAVHEAAVG